MRNAAIEAPESLPGDSQVIESSTIVADAATAPRAIAFSPDGNLIAAAIGSDKLRVWDAADRKPKATFDRGAGGAGTHIAFSLDNGLIAAGNMAGEVHLFDANALKPGAVLNEKKSRAARDVVGPVTALAFTPDGKTLAEACGHQVHLYDLAKKTRRATARHPGVVGMAISRNGSIIATSGADRSLRLWDPNDPKMTVPRVVQQLASPALVLVFDADSKRLAAGCADGTLLVWDVVSAGEPLVFRGHRSAVQGLSFTPDGKLLASCAADRIVIWDVADKRALASLRKHRGGVHSVAFAPNADTLASSGVDNVLRFWDFGKLRQPEAK